MPACLGPGVSLVWSGNTPRRRRRLSPMTADRPPRRTLVEAVRADHAAVADRAQPRLAGADVPVLRDRRRARRLAPGAPRRPRDRWLRAGDDRGRGRGPRGPDLPAGRRHLERRAGRGLAPRRRLRARPGRADRRPARPRRPQGVDLPALGRAVRLGPADEGGWPTVAPVAVPFEGYADPAALTVEEIARRRAGVRRRHPARRRGRLRHRRDPRRARLPAPPVPLAAVQPPRGRLRRLVREPHPAAARDRRRRARGAARDRSPAGADLRHRLARRRLGPRAEHPARRTAEGARGRPGRRLLRRQRPGLDPGRARLPGAARRPASASRHRRPARSG